MNHFTPSDSQSLGHEAPVLGLPSLEQLPHRVMDQSLDGRQGTNRATGQHCQLAAKNDWEAVLCWLEEYSSVSTTYRAYQKEAERLLLWCIFHHHKPLSSLNRSDLEAYREFLSDPAPAAIWCGPKGAKRGTPKWRPFVGPLSLQAQQTTLAIIYSLLSYLADAHYLADNPLRLTRNKKAQKNKATAAQSLVRILEDDEWSAILTILAESPEQNEQEKFYKQRLKMIIYLLYFTGIRVSELVHCDWNHFKKVRGNWWLYVIGKGSKQGKIPINDALFIAIAEYRLFLGKALEPDPEEAEPVLMSWKNKTRLTDRRVNMLLKALGVEAAKRFVNEVSKVQRLQAFSAHWLRHLSGTMQDRAGIKDTHIQANHRHGKIDTTRQYIHAMDEARHQDMMKLKLQPQKNSVQGITR